MSAATVLYLEAAADEEQDPTRGPRHDNAADSRASAARRAYDSAAARQCDPEPSLYRARTTALLRRYFRMSIELGRLPNILGREFFRSKVSSYKMSTFEDVVILVHDVDRCLARLELFEQQLVARVVLEEYSHSEAAVVLRCTRRTVTRRLPEALDLLSKIFLETGLLRPMGEEHSGLRSAKNPSAKSCQAPSTDDFDVSA